MEWNEKKEKKNWNGMCNSRHFSLNNVQLKTSYGRRHELYASAFEIYSVEIY